jgi:hypothetical protein
MDADMHYQRALQLIYAALGAGVTRPALEDALRLGRQEFGEAETLTDWELRDWGQRLRTSHPHYFQPAKPLAAPAAPAFDWSTLPPIERLARYREQQAAQTQAGQS